MKLMEIKEMSPVEISEQLGKSRVELVNLRMKLASRQLEDTSVIKKKRKEIARLLTVQTEKGVEPSSVEIEKSVAVKKTKRVKQVKEVDEIKKEDKKTKTTKRKLKEKEEKDA